MLPAYKEHRRLRRYNTVIMLQSVKEAHLALDNQNIFSTSYKHFHIHKIYSALSINTFIYIKYIQGLCKMNELSYNSNCVLRRTILQLT